MANALRGEADLLIGGKTHTICINMGALARISEACGVDNFTDMPAALLKFSNMPKVVRACLEANGLKDVTDDQIAAMDWEQYTGPLLDAILRRKSKEDAEADPPKGQRKK